MKLKVFSLWAIDEICDVSLLKCQLRDIRSLGFDGVVFHPRRYCGSPEYLSSAYMKVLSELILYAKEIGAEFWLYDENGWPSGSADGGVMRSMPKLKCRWLECANGSVSIKESSGINSLDRDGVRCFIELTHERYKNGLAPEAFEYVGGFFSDEVGFLGGHGACMEHGGIPWSEELAGMYREEFGDEIYGELPKLFCEREDSFKIWYWERLTELLTESFYGAIEDWCAKNGKLFTAHLKGEEHPLFQIGYSGSCVQVLRRISVPSIDALERRPGNAYYMHTASSASRQFGSGIAMAEALGGAGWGLTPGDVEEYANKLIDCGTNLLIFHINQLHLTYDGITDWPASIPCHEPWRDSFRQLTERMRHRAEYRKEPDTLLIAPVRGTINRFAPKLVRGMNEHDGSHCMVSEALNLSRRTTAVGERMFEAGISYDVTDERVFEDNAAVTGSGKLSLGRCEYKRVVIIKGCEFGERGREIICETNCCYDTELFSGGINQTPWRITAPKRNIYLVNISSGCGIIDAEYICDCELTVSDECSVYVNGTELEFAGRGQYGYKFILSRKLLYEGRNTVKLGTEKAFVCITGNFAVKNRSPFYELDERQYETENGFYIAAPCVPGCDMISGGYPFAAEPVIFEKTLKGRIKGRLRINCAHIAAAHVFADGKECGWVYRGCDTVPVSCEDGETTLKCIVYQSAYNIFGPHRYITGDTGIVSPMQYDGKKNFADASFLPDDTKVEMMRLVRWSMADTAELIDDPNV